MICDICSKVPIWIIWFAIPALKFWSKANYLRYALRSPDLNQMIRNPHSKVPIWIKNPLRSSDLNQWFVNPLRSPDLNQICDTPDSTLTSWRRLLDVCIYIWKMYFLAHLDISFQMSNRRLLDVLVKLTSYICQMFVHSRCFPDQVIFNRHLADVCVCVLSGTWSSDLNQMICEHTQSPNQTDSRTHRSDSNDLRTHIEVLIWIKLFTIRDPIRVLQKWIILRHNGLTDSEFKKTPFHPSQHVLFKIIPANKPAVALYGPT